MREDPLYNLVPGYREAVQRETDLRDAAFLPVTDSICGVEVNQLTPFHLAALTLARSPFICGGMPFPRDIALFLWCVSPEYNPRAVVSRWLFIRRVAKLDYREAVEGVMRYVGEAIRLHRPDVKDPVAEIVRVLDLVGIRDPEKRHRDYPHQLSGGMQQRVMIAMALVCQPKILVADEPTTALDVTIQAQIIALLRELKQKLGMSVLMITHNFGIVHGFADRVIVMFRGKIVEEGPAEVVLRQPQHPYTRALIACIPRLGQKQGRLVTIDYSTLGP